MISVFYNLLDIPTNLLYSILLFNSLIRFLTTLSTALFFYSNLSDSTWKLRSDWLVWLLDEVERIHVRFDAAHGLIEGKEQNGC
jgi:hypothetical protein